MRSTTFHDSRQAGRHSPRNAEAIHDPPLAMFHAAGMHRLAITAMLILALAAMSCGGKKTAAESELLASKATLTARTATMIREMLHRLPGIDAHLEGEFCAGRRMRAVIQVDGLSEGDSVLRGPVMHVYNGGTEVATVTAAPSGGRESGDPGARWYVAEWTPPDAGRYELWMEAGTNHIVIDSTAKGAEVRIGTFRFARAQVEEVIEKDSILTGTPLEAFARRSASLDPAKLTVHVPTAEEYERSRREERRELQALKDAEASGRIRRVSIGESKK